MNRRVFLKMAGAGLACLASGCAAVKPSPKQPNIVFIFSGEHNVPAHEGVQTDHYKLIHYYDTNEWELFDLEKDPQEMKSVYGDSSYASVVKTMKNELARVRKEYKVPPLKRGERLSKDKY